MIDFSNLNYLSASVNVFSVFFCCYLFAKAFLRVSPAVIIVDCVIFGMACVLALPLVSRYTFFHDNRGLLLFFALYFPVFHFSLELTLARTLVIYLWSVVLFVFPSNISCIIDASLHPEHMNMTFAADAFGVHLVFCALLCLFAFFAISRIDTRFFSPANTPETLWYGWLSVPILFLGLNIALLPESYRLLHVNLLYPTYLFFSGSLFVLYLYLTTIFYSHMIEYVHIQEYKEAQRIADIQMLQFENLQAQIEADRHARHDFKHTLHLLTQMAASGDAQALLAYIREYTKESSGAVLKNYCGNPAINAIINYYEDRAQQEGVITNLQVDLPGSLPMSDPEFCSLIGNIMENAINAAKNAPLPNRRFSISIQVQNDSTLYIVSSNDYDISLNQETTEKISFFSSKKQKLHGIGLQSIRETVDKYSGTLRISRTDTEYFLDIAIRI